MTDLFRWTLKNKKADYKLMSSQLKLSEEICKIMVNRGITSRDAIEEYLHPHVEKLHDPKSMWDMKIAVDLLSEAIASGNSIRIVSDYDVDGVMSCTILYKALKKCQAKVDYVIPHRVYDGYGINERIVMQAKEDQIDLLITCDNGISAFSPIELAKTLGLKVIITDHHQIPYEVDEDNNKVYRVPCADAIINPKQDRCQYPFKELCGAGVAFKLIQYLYEVFNFPYEEALKLIEYVALATICDIVDLTGENRTLVKNGLEALNNTENLGLKELIKINSQQDKKVNSYTVGFIIGPCINAAGRLDRGDKAVELLLTEEEVKARALATEIFEFNSKRRELTEEGFEKVIQNIENSTIKDDKVKVIYHREVHESVAGIIAGRVKDRYHVPVIVLTNAEGFMKGSGRSIELYNIYEELATCSDILEKFGGHSMAAGLSISELNISKLSQRLNGRFHIPEEELIPKLVIDALLPIHQVSLTLIDELEFLEPFGKGNGKPVFGDKDVRIIKGRIFGKNNNVLSLKLVSASSEVVEGVYFGDVEGFNETIIERFGAEELEKMYNGLRNSIVIDIAYFPKLNDYRGNKNTQIQLLHIK